MFAEPESSLVNERVVGCRGYSNTAYNNNNILIYKAQLNKSAQSAVQLLRNAYKTHKT